MVPGRADGYRGAPQRHRLTLTTRVWDLSLRLWHWLFAGAISVSLATGLSDNIGLMDWHLRSGYVVLGLLAFRLCWGIAGTRHARFASYRTTPGALLRYLRPASDTTTSGAHTPPGVVLAWAVWLTCLVQASAGLFTSDDIFTDGPLVRYVDDAKVDLAGSIHHRAFWLLLALVVGHVVAITWYGLVRRDPLALSMFTGRKAIAVEPVGDRPIAAACAWTVAVIVFATFLNL